MSSKVFANAHPAQAHLSAYFTFLSQPFIGKCSKNVYKKKYFGIFSSLTCLAFGFYTDYQFISFDFRYFPVYVK